MNLAIIGNGNIVKSALEALKEVPQINVVALCVRKQSIDKGKLLQQQHNIPQLYTDYDALLTHPDVDCVYIGIINLLHYEYTKKALLANKSVILEKPSCLHASEMEALTELCLSKKLFLFEAVTFIHNKFFQQIVDNIQNIGPVKLVQCNFSKYSSRYDQYLQQQVHAVFDPSQGGGTLVDMNIYNINFTVSLLGMPQKVHYFANRGFNGIDTSGIAILVYPDFVAECCAAKDSSSPGFMMIQGEKGWIKIEGAPDAIEALHIHIGAGSKGETTSISLQNIGHRMKDEFCHFAQMYAQKDDATMKHYLNISNNVCKVAEMCVTTANQPI